MESRANLLEITLGQGQRSRERFEQFHPLLKRHASLPFPFDLLLNIEAPNGAMLPQVKFSVGQRRIGPFFAGPFRLIW